MAWTSSCQTTAPRAANYDQRSLGGRTKVANAPGRRRPLVSKLASQRRRPAGSKADSSALTAYALQSGSRRIPGNGLKDSSGRRDHGPRCPRRQSGRKRAGRPAFHGGRVGHTSGGRHQDSKCWPRYATNAALSASKATLQSALDATLADLAALTRRPGRGSRLGIVEATLFATCVWRLLSLLRWPTATTR